MKSLRNIKKYNVPYLQKKRYYRKTGDSDLRKAFYMPAVVSIKLIKAFYQGLINQGKPTMVAIIAAMRKLLHIIYGVLKTQTLFNKMNGKNFQKSC